MIEQPPTVPYVIPGPWPFRLFAPREAIQTPALSLYTSAYRTYIPASIRAAFEAPLPADRWDIAKDIPQSLEIHIASYEWLTTTGGFVTVPGGWGGIYQTPRIAVTNNQAEAPKTLVHEFGHHVDQTYNTLWQNGDGSTKRLTETEPFLALWKRVNGSIPTTEYAKVSPAEWFAQSWRYQLWNEGAGLLKCAGGNYSAMLELRELFTDLLPMPNMTTL